MPFEIVALSLMIGYWTDVMPAAAVVVIMMVIYWYHFIIPLCFQE